MIYGDDYVSRGARKMIISLMSVVSTQSSSAEFSKMGQMLWSEGYDVITIGIGNDPNFQFEVMFNYYF